MEHEHIVYVLKLVSHTKSFFYYFIISKSLSNFVSIITHLIHLISFLIIFSFMYHIMYH